MLKTGALLATVLLAILLLTGCSGKEASQENLSPVSLVPETSSMIGLMDLERLLRDEDLKRAFTDIQKRADQPGSFDDALAQAEKEMGIDLRRVKQVVFFAEVANPDATTGAFLKGQWTKAEVVKNLERKSGQSATVRSYEGYELLTGAEEKQGLIFLADDLLLFGATSTLKSVVDVKQRKKQAIKGRLLDKYNALGSGLVKIALEVPSDFKKDLAKQPPGGPSPFSLKAFEEVGLVGIALDKRGELISLKIDLDFASAALAEDARATLEGTRLLLRGVLDVPEAKRLLDGIKVDRKDSSLAVTLESSIKELQGLEKLLEGMQ